MNRAEKIQELMDKIHGRFVPTFFWENHEPMKYWYDADKDAICVDSGDEKKIELKDDELTWQTIEKLIDKLEDDLIEKYNLEVPMD